MFIVKVELRGAQIAQHFFSGQMIQIAQNYELNSSDIFGNFGVYYRRASIRTCMICMRDVISSSNEIQFGSENLTSYDQ